MNACRSSSLRNASQVCSGMPRYSLPGALPNSMRFASARKASACFCGVVIVGFLLGRWAGLGSRCRCGLAWCVRWLVRLLGRGRVRARIVSVVLCCGIGRNRTGKTCVVRCLCRVSSMAGCRSSFGHHAHFAVASILVSRVSELVLECFGAPKVFFVGGPRRDDFPLSRHVSSPPRCVR